MNGSEQILGLAWQYRAQGREASNINPTFSGSQIGLFDLVRNESTGNRTSLPDQNITKIHM